MDRIEQFLQFFAYSCILFLKGVIFAAIVVTSFTQNGFNSLSFQDIGTFTLFFSAF